MWIDTRSSFAMKHYDARVEARMKTLYRSLSEKDRRRYAAVEADKLGYGGTEYIAALFGVDAKTIRQGLADLDEPEDPAGRRVRKKGGGRKRKTSITPELHRVFLDVIAEHTAGDPQHGIRWTNLKPREIAQRITKAGIPVSRRIACHLLKQHHLARRQSQKKTSFKQHPHRNTQFERITELKRQYLTAGLPVISVDTKKKELLGNFYRSGKLYTSKTIEVLDHDFPSYSIGKIVPHGVYDIGMNKAHVNIGTSGDTTEFACDSLAHWWHTHGRIDHPEAHQLLMLCDGGGSNPAGSALFHQDLQTLANHTGLEVRVAHYPAYCSKHNPIEHKVFPHVSRACEGVVFTSVPLVKELIERTETRTGLRVTADIINRVYESGRKAAAHVKESLKIAFDKLLPKWNYVVSPQEAA
jgi:hypothetical protein